jgi:hypothetical protein
MDLTTGPWAGIFFACACRGADLASDVVPGGGRLVNGFIVISVSDESNSLRLLLPVAPRRALWETLLSSSA